MEQSVEDMSSPERISIISAQKKSNCPELDARQ